MSNAILPSATLDLRASPVMPLFTGDDAVELLDLIGSAHARTLALPQPKNRIASSGRAVLNVIGGVIPNPEAPCVYQLSISR